MELSSEQNLDSEIDVIIIGAGLAGITAAYYAAKMGLRTIVFERLPGQGMLDHPCACMVGPVPGLMTFQLRPDGVYYRELDFLFPSDMILAYPRQMMFFGPNGNRFGMQVRTPLHKYPIFQVDKENLLRALAERAVDVGAEIKYGSPVTHLLSEFGKICGVVLDRKEIRGKVVISAEGLSRKFAIEAGLYAGQPNLFCWFAAGYYDRAQTNPEMLGQFSYFGRNYSPLPKSAIHFHTLGNDRAMVLLSVFVPERRWPYGQPIMTCLEEAVTHTPQIRDLLPSTRRNGAKGCVMSLQKPMSLVADGFIGAGDCIAPLGHSSIASAMLLGKEAALVANTALRQGSASVSNLSKYNKWMKSRLFQGVEFEANLITAMMDLSDPEMDRLCQSLAGINLEPFFIGFPIQQALAGVKLLLNPEIRKNWGLIKRVFF